MNTFIYSTYINTTPEKLWEALTTSDFTRKYWGGLDIQSDWKVGSMVKMFYQWGTKEGKVIRFDPPKALSYTGIGGTDSVVTFEIIHVSPKEVRLNIHHQGFGDDSKNAIAEGWFAIMSSLKTLLETGTALDHSWWRG